MAAMRNPNPGMVVMGEMKFMGSFRVLLCVDGCGTIRFDGGEITFYKGDCIFVPANSAVLTIHGQAQFLDVRG